MKTQTITATRMAAAGVSFSDANWYFTIGRPGGFKGPGAAERASKILLQTCKVKH